MPWRYGGRPTWAEIDVAALRWNLRQVRRLTGPKRPVLAVVKANAYGHGAALCARALAAAGADQFGVASVEEGRELRQAGIRQPIVVFGLLQPPEAEEAAVWRLEPTVVFRSQVLALSRAARKRGMSVPVHLKVDTGMGRIGLAPGEAPAFLDWLRGQSGIRLAGIFTHFAQADGRDRSLLRRQMRRLTEAADAAHRLGWRGYRVHAANSAAVIEAPETHADMVRPGLMLYGVYPAERFKRRVRLRPVLRWVSRIIQVKQVPAGTGLSYGHTFVTRRSSRIATLPVGYADGFSRAWSNRGQVLVAGRLCPIVGRVCMDMCLADVTAAGPVAVGAEAVLIGRQGRRERTADDLAASLGTISYEVLCAIGARVPRLAIAPEAKHA